MPFGILISLVAKEINAMKELQKKEQVQADQIEIGAIGMPHI